MALQNKAERRIICSNVNRREEQLMKESEYRPRIIDRKVDEYLSAFGAVCIEGPKWCGKTWTSAFHSKSDNGISFQKSDK